MAFRIKILYDFHTKNNQKLVYFFDQIHVLKIGLIVSLISGLISGLINPLWSNYLKNWSNYSKTSKYSKMGKVLTIYPKKQVSVKVDPVLTMLLLLEAPFRAIVDRVVFHCCSILGICKCSKE
jgi:hypothetical protein